MKNFLNDYFYYTQSERNGLIVLLLLLVLMMSIPPIYSYFHPKEEPNFTAFQQEIAAFTNEQTSRSTPPSSSFQLFHFDPNTASIADLTRLGLSQKLANTINNYRTKGGQFRKVEDLKTIYGLQPEDYDRLAPFIQIKNQPKPKSTSSPKETGSKSPPTLFPFNPNTADQSQLSQLGLSQKAIRILLNYRKKGGTFRKKEDLKKVFGITKADYQRLESYILIEPSAAKPKASVAATAPKTVSPPKALVIDINTADTTEWQQLRGIGPTYARRIVKFREKLGGFSSIVQLKETYGLPDSTFQSIQAFLQLSPVFQKLPINTADWKELVAHPYISSKQARVIINYRKQHGAFKSHEEMSKLVVISSDQLKKLAPYLSFE